MKVIRTVNEMLDWSRDKHEQGRRIGLVPTMGYLHEGHLSLIRVARKNCDDTIVSIFVNPTQFGPHEDLDNYPRDFQRDMELCKQEKVSCVFYPSLKDIYSPFHRDTLVTFKPLNYYDPNPDYVFKSKLFFKEIPDTVIIMGTKGEPRTVIVIGHVELNKDSKIHPVNIYKAFSRNGETYYSIWFTDKTTGKETYGVGRYLDFELEPDSNFIYTIDFNKAYNPFCAYSHLFTCPIPREEDYLDMAIEAGEKNFH